MMQMTSSTSTCMLLALRQRGEVWRMVWWRRWHYHQQWIGNINIKCNKRWWRQRRQWLSSNDCCASWQGQWHWISLFFTVKSWMPIADPRTFFFDAGMSFRRDVWKYIYQVFYEKHGVLIPQFTRSWLHSLHTWHFMWAKFTVLEW